MPKVVILTTFGAVNGDNFIKITTILFQWLNIYTPLRIQSGHEAVSTMRLQALKNSAIQKSHVQRTDNIKLLRSYFGSNYCRTRNPTECKELTLLGFKIFKKNSTFT